MELSELPEEIQGVYVAASDPRSHRSLARDLFLGYLDEYGIADPCPITAAEWRQKEPELAKRNDRWYYGGPPANEKEQLEVSARVADTAAWHQELLEGWREFEAGRIGLEDWRQALLEKSGLV